MTVTDAISDDHAVPLLEHLRELRSRLIVCLWIVMLFSGLAYAFYDPIIAALTAPFGKVHFEHQLYMSTFFEPFTLRLKISMLTGILLALPFLLFHLLRFIFPALKPAEKRLVGVVLAVGSVIAALSVYFTYCWIIPFSLNFLMSRDFVPPGVSVMLNLGENLYYLVLFLLCATIVFQIPLVLEVMMYFNLVHWRTLLKYGRFIVVLIFIVAAIITPPEMISQCCVAVPLVALFYLAILVAKICKFGE